MPDGAAFCFPSAFDFQLLLHCVLQTRCNANVILCCILNSNTLAPNQPALPEPAQPLTKKRVRLGSNLTCSFTPTAMFQSPTSTRVAAVSCCDDAALFARGPVPCVHSRTRVEANHNTHAHTASSHVSHSSLRSQWPLFLRFCPSDLHVMLQVHATLGLVQRNPSWSCASATIAQDGTLHPYFHSQLQHSISPIAPIMFFRCTI